MLGLIGRKIGMTQVFDDSGFVTPVTVVEIFKNKVVGKKTVDRDGYDACILGAVDKKKSRVSKPYMGQFPEGVEPTKELVEFRDFDKDCVVGDVFGVEVFENLFYVDVIGTSKGKGFQGAMKRHNFQGGRATHGSKFHRDLGGTGMAATPSRVFKGTKMAGRLGASRVTVQNLEVVRVDVDKSIILIKGAVPGPSKGTVVVREAIKK